MTQRIRFFPMNGYNTILFRAVTKDVAMVATKNTRAQTELDPFYIDIHQCDKSGKNFQFPKSCFQIFVLQNKTKIKRNNSSFFRIKIELKWDYNETTRCQRYDIRFAWLLSFKMAAFVKDQKLRNLLKKYVMSHCLHC